jgi:hydroxyethylthiazole kinase-like uncharacterized protein yjeF
VRPVYDVTAIRAAEKAVMAQLPDGALMQRAATALARRSAALLRRVYGARVVVLVGKGNNGGDALYAGAKLAARGARVDAVLTADADPPAALAALIDAGGHPTSMTDAAAELIADADLVIDGLLGIGGKGALRGAAAKLAEMTAGCDALVVAVDVPSGVEAATGRVPGVAVRADVTVTFGARKPGLVVAPGAAYAGQVECVDIGLGPHLPPPQLVVADADDIADMLPDDDGVDEVDKYRRGVCGVIAGSDAYAGAAVLATGGAVVGGAGMVRFASSARPAHLVNGRWPEAIVTVLEAGASLADVGRVQAWAVGPGLGTDEGAVGLVEQALAAEVPVLVDADALTVVGDHRSWLDRPAPTQLTPHAGEFARLMGTERAEVEGDRLSWVRRAADELGVTVLLKGSTTLVAAPDGRVTANPTGTAKLGTAGSGDVLSGAGGALLARGLGAFEAATAAAFLHGLAGRLATAGDADLHAGSIIEAWPDAVRAVRGARGGG